VGKEGKLDVLIFAVTLVDPKEDSNESQLSNNLRTKNCNEDKLLKLELQGAGWHLKISLQITADLLNRHTATRMFFIYLSLSLFKEPG
jgi:hypothetical protein